MRSKIMTSSNSNSGKKQSRAASKQSARSKRSALIKLDFLNRWRSSSTRKTTSSGGQSTSTQRTSARKDHRSRQAKSHTAPPPVMVRSYNMDMPLQPHQAYTKKNRRRMDIPLNIPGAEMRLPSVPVFRASVKWLSLLLVLVLLAGLYFLWNAPFFRVGQASVEGVKRVKISDVNAVLDIDGKPIFTIRPGELQKKLMTAFPEFASAVVQASMPHSVTVKVSERIPALTWRQGNQTQLIDANGFIFPLRLEASRVISPVVEAAGAPPLAARSTEEILSSVSGAVNSSTEAKSGSSSQADVDKAASGGPFLRPEMVKAILAMAEVIPANGLLLYDPNHGFGWQDQRGWKVYLGDDQDVDMKLKVYEAIVKRLEDEQIQPVLISVEHIHNPYYRLEQ